MKRRKLCCGILLLSFITLGLSLSVSFDTNALKHDVQYIPIASDSALRGGSSNVLENIRFSISWVGSYQPDRSQFARNQLHFFDSSILNNNCTFIANSSGYYTRPTISGDYSTDFNFGFYSYRYNYRTDSSYPGTSDYVRCRQTVPFGTIYPNQSNIYSHPNFDDSSLVNIPLADRPPYLGLSPYYYDYDSFYIHDSATSTSTGNTYNNTLHMSEIVGFIPNKFKQISIPLGRVNEDVTGVITEGRHIKYHGVFDFSGQDTYMNLSQNFVDNGYFQLVYGGLTESQSVVGNMGDSGGVVNCSSNQITLPSTGFNQLEFDCEFDSNFTEYNGQMWFYLRIGVGSGYIFDTNADWTFSSAYFMTDNDDTPGGTWGTTPTGNNLANAPGSADKLVPDDEDFFEKLTNLFNFNLFNPLAGIFNLFSDQSQCAHIPTISGMIHSESDTVCPWFDSNTRNITTPVLGLASTMLLFGFVVHWLGARSGNMFTDTTNEEVSNQGGRWGHFKKGGAK